MISLTADAGEAAWTGSTLFAVTADAGFSASYLARIAPVSTGNGYWMVAFFGSDGGYVGGVQIPFAAARADAGNADRPRSIRRRSIRIRHRQPADRGKL